MPGYQKLQVVDSFVVNLQAAQSCFYGAIQRRITRLLPSDSSSDSWLISLRSRQTVTHSSNLVALDWLLHHVLPRCI